MVRDKADHSIEANQGWGMCGDTCEDQEVFVIIIIIIIVLIIIMRNSHHCHHHHHKDMKKFIIQTMLKVQESQLTGKARVKKVEILDQRWCDDKWVIVTIIIIIITIVLIIIFLTLHIIITIIATDIIEGMFSFKTCSSPTRTGT